MESCRKLVHVILLFCSAVYRIADSHLIFPHDHAWNEDADFPNGPTTIKASLAGKVNIAPGGLASMEVPDNKETMDEAEKAADISYKANMVPEDVKNLWETENRLLPQHLAVGDLPSVGHEMPNWAKDFQQQETAMQRQDVKVLNRMRGTENDPEELDYMGKESSLDHEQSVHMSDDKAHQHLPDGGFHKPDNEKDIEKMAIEVELKEIHQTKPPFRVKPSGIKEFLIKGGQPVFEEEDTFIRNVRRSSRERQDMGTRLPIHPSALKLHHNWQDDVSFLEDQLGSSEDEANVSDEEQQRENETVADIEDYNDMEPNEMNKSRNIATKNSFDVLGGTTNTGGSIVTSTFARADGANETTEEDVKEQEAADDILPIFPINDGDKIKLRIHHRKFHIPTMRPKTQRKPTTYMDIREFSQHDDKEVQSEKIRRASKSSKADSFRRRGLGPTHRSSKHSSKACIRSETKKESSSVNKTKNYDDTLSNKILISIDIRGPHSKGKRRPITLETDDAGDMHVIEDGSGNRPKRSTHVKKDLSRQFENDNNSLRTADSKDPNHKKRESSVQ